jgi:hypothetical protein
MKNNTATATTTAIKTMRDSRGFQISGLNGYTLSIGVGSGHYCENQGSRYGDDSNKPTSTMEVAVMRDGGDCEFVCLPMDVAGYVPAGNLGPLIQAVSDHDWYLVCSLCGEYLPSDTSKFPKE